MLLLLHLPLDSQLHPARKRELLVARRQKREREREEGIRETILDIDRIAGL
jgi:hypothetical protein